MTRGGALIAVVLAVFCGGWQRTTQAAHAASPIVTMTVSGPSTLTWPIPAYVDTVVVTNVDAVAGTGLVLSTNLTGFSTIDGPIDCSVMCSISHLPLSPIAPGATATIAIHVNGPSGYGPVHETFTLLTADDSVVASAVHDYDIVLPPTVADWRVSVSNAARTGGLGARHRITATNLGPADATGVVIYDHLDYNETLSSTSPSQGSCSSPPPTPNSQNLITCSIGFVRAHATVTVDVDTRLSPSPEANYRVVQVQTQTPGVDDTHQRAAGDTIFHDRFWASSCCSLIFQDGYQLYPYFTVASDDTVRYSDGAVITRDGVLIRNDCKLFYYTGALEPPPPGATPPCSGTPGAPQSVAATAGDGSATVTWTPPAFDGGSPVTSYTIGTPHGVAATAGPTATSVVVSGLANRTTYTFTVRARNLLGPGKSSPASNAVTLATVPDAPTNVSAVPGDTQATVSWSPPLHDGGSPLTGYVVTSEPGGLTVSPDGKTTSAVVGGLRNGVSYTFAVVARNALGSSAPSVSGAIEPVAPRRDVVKTPGPVIRSFAPVKGKPRTRVTIRGSSFRNVTTVTFNGRRASYRVQSPTVIVATVPARASSGKITVRTRSGAVVTKSAFAVNK